MMQLTITGFAQIVRIIKEMSDKLCSGRLVFSLEGGYELRVLASSVKTTFDVLLGKTDIEDKLGGSPHRLEVPDITSLIKLIKEVHKLS
jgi:acetoin utilization deacetylase AcuC-like enzyme